ncbi:MAG TPA: hypothetical protein VM864_03510 [Pyrinomonadaceae bacterium]|nr:hypothetical protein [Pyrinomonadaceae bacterium]
MKAPTLVALSLLALWPPAAPAQAPAAGKPPAARPRPKASNAAYDPLAESRRTTAVTLISSLADEARSFRDEMLRARVQARAADALWETEQERSRALFRRAWDAADLADKEITRRVEEDKRRQLAAGGNVMLSRPANLRSEVLRLAAKRDRALGEEFLAKLDEQRKQDERDAAAKLAAAQADAPAPNTPAGLSFDTNHRIELARQLLQNGDAERAQQFAAPALQQPTRDAVFFITDLREKSPEAADKLFAALLARVAADPSSDANAVSTLSSYVFTPHLVINIERGGGFNTYSSGRTTPPENFPAALRTMFMQTAAQVLLRPPAPPDQDRTSGGRAATYFIIARLLPLFEQYLPASVASLRAQLSALTPDAPEEVRDSNNRMLSEGLTRDEADRRDDVQDALDRLDRATTDEERDRLYVEASLAASGRRDPRARSLAESVKDSATREQLLAYVDFNLARGAIEKKDVNETLRIARTGAMTHLQNVWALTEAARLSAKENRPLALDLLDEASLEARKIDPGESDRPRALLAVAAPLYELDPSRVWSLMPDLVKAVNAVPEFTGEDGRLVIRFRTKNHSSIYSSTVDAFNLQPLFQTLARADMNRAVELAKNFTGESPRAVATLAVATAVLSDTAKPTDTAKPKAKA